MTERVELKPKVRRVWNEERKEYEYVCDHCFPRVAAWNSGAEG